jgi:hypothetical protein
MSPLEHGWADSFRREFLLPQRLCGKRTGNSSRAVKFARRARRPGQWWSTIRAHIRQYSACAASQRCTVRSLTSRTAARSFCNRSMALRRRANSVPAMRPSIRRVEGEFNRTYPGSTTLSDVAVFVRAGARRHIAVLIENPVSGHENVSGTVDQPVTDAGHILAKRGVAVRRRTIVAVRRPIKIAVMYRGSLVNAMQAVIACGRNADRAGLDEERSDRDANHKRKAFIERHRALGVGPPKPMAGAIGPFRQEKK